MIRVVFVTACDTMQGDVQMAYLALSRLDPGEFKITAIVPPWGETRAAFAALPQVRTITMDMGGVEGTPSEDLPRYKRYLAAARSTIRITALLVRERADLVYAIDRTVGAHIAGVSSMIARRPFLLGAHYPWFPFAWRVNRWTMRRATMIHSPTDFLTGQWAPYVRDPSIFVKTPNAIDLDNFRPREPDRAFLERVGVKAGAPVVVMVGRLAPYKGQEDLIRATAQIVERRPDVQVLIAGHTTHDDSPFHAGFSDYRSVLEELVAELGLSGQVHLLGGVPRRELPALISNATVMAMPSWEEPFGLVALEGMAMGKPVVATNAGGVPEFVEDGRTGLLVPPRTPEALADALLRVIDDTALAQRLGSAAREQVATTYSADRYVASVAGVMRDAAATRRALVSSLR